MRVKRVHRWIKGNGYGDGDGWQAEAKGRQAGRQMRESEPAGKMKWRGQMRRHSGEEGGWDECSTQGDTVSEGARKQGQ